VASPDPAAGDPQGAAATDLKRAPPPTSQRGILRSATIMTAMTLISRILGLVREQVRAVLVGTGAASDAFGLATTIPNLFRRLFAEGAMTAAFVPIFTEHLTTSTREETRRFLSRFVTLLTFAVTAFTVVAILITPWLIDTFFATEFKNVPGKVQLTIALTELMWPYLVFVSLAAVAQGVLNAHHIFGPSAFAPVLMNLAIIVGALVFKDSFGDPSYGLVIGFLGGGIFQLLFQIPWLFSKTQIRIRFDFHFRDPEVRRVLKVMVPGIFAAGIYQFNVFVSQLVASGLPEGSVSSLQYSLRLQELVLGVFVVSVAQVILPSLSEHTAKGDVDAVKRTTNYAVRLIAFITLPATVVLVILGAPIVEGLFQFGAFTAESTAKTALALDFHGAGLLFIGQARVLTQVFFSYKDLRTPTYISIADAALNVGLCVGLSHVMGHGGIALASTLAAVGNSTLLHIFLARKIGSLGLRELLLRGARILAASAVMAAALVAFMTVFPAPHTGRLALIGWVFLALGLGGGVYLGAATLFRVNELESLFAALKRRFARRR
jgi:putative peptidoglycan lipid II flippase